MPEAPDRPTVAARSAPTGGPVDLPRLAGASLTVLQSRSAVPEADGFLKTQIETDFMPGTGATVTLDLVPPAELQPRIAAAIQAGTGPDLVLLPFNWAHLYKQALSDLGDIAEPVSKLTGDFFPVSAGAVVVDGSYLAVPHDLVPSVIHWRRSWFKEVGLESFPRTFADLFTAARKLKLRGRPLGQAFGHSPTDPPTWCYPLLWAYGGQEIDLGGKVAISSPGAIAAVRAMKEAWVDAFDESGPAWDDSSNDRAFPGGSLAATLNDTTIWWNAYRDRSPLVDDIALDLPPAGPAGRFLWARANSYALLRHSRNADAARAFIRWSMSDHVWLPWFALGAAHHCPVGPLQDDNQVWPTLPAAVRSLKGAGRLSRPPGWPGPYGVGASLALTRFTIVDLFARAIERDSPELAVRWAENELTQAYSQLPPG